MTHREYPNQTRSVKIYTALPQESILGSTQRDQMEFDNNRGMQWLLTLPSKIIY